MKHSKIFCTNCGKENLSEHNFCFSCGEKLLSNSNESEYSAIKQNVIDNTQKKFVDITQALKELLNHDGFIIVSCGDYFVQFANDKKNKTTLFEAVSQANAVDLKDDIDGKFQKLGFDKIPNSNFSKSLDSTTIEVNLIIEEISTIFREIYNTPLENYSIEKNIENPTPSKNKKSSKNNGCLTVFLIFIGLIFLYFILYDFGSNSDTNYDSNVLVENSSYDGSVRQVTVFLKHGNYLLDPKSYEGIEWSKVQQESDNQYYSYKVRHMFRSKNTYGGYTVSNKVFYLDIEGNVVDVVDY